MPPSRIHTYDVGGDAANLRIDKFLALHLADLSRSHLQKIISAGNVRVNGRTVRPSYLLKPQDRIEVCIPAAETTDLVPEKIPLNIIYEDSALIVINKPPGLVVHPGAGVRSGTLVNALMYHCRDLSGVGGRLRPGIVHRLDKNTSGLLVAAKNDRAHLALQEQFASKTAVRRYKALVWGALPEKEGKIETCVNRSKSDRKKFSVSPQGKLAITLYRVEKQFGFLSLIDVQLKTGRTHQIRIHLNYLHHPVFGDPDYSGREKQVRGLASGENRSFARKLLKMIDRQALHTYYLGFYHPEGGQWREFSAPLPDDFQQVLDALIPQEENIK